MELMLRIKPEGKVRSRSERKRTVVRLNFYFAASGIFRRIPSALSLQSAIRRACDALSGLISSSHSIFTGGT